MIQFDESKQIWSDEKTHAPIEREMKRWRNGLVAFPESYRTYHFTLAGAATGWLQSRGYTVHRSYVDDAGDLDGMRVTHLIVETPRRRLLKLRWHDSNSRGYWMEVHAGGYATLYRVEEGE
jgi:hypothetical protein